MKLTFFASGASYAFFVPLFPSILLFSLLVYSQNRKYPGLFRSAALFARAGSFAAGYAAQSMPNHAHGPFTQFFRKFPRFTVPKNLCGTVVTGIFIGTATAFRNRRPLVHLTVDTFPGFPESVLQGMLPKHVKVVAGQQITRPVNCEG